MARPTKDEHERRKVYSLRLTEAETEHVRAQAEAAGVSVSEYLRRRALGYQVPTLQTAQADAALISEINRVGVNVNQLARSVHMGSDFTHYWREAGAELAAIMRKVVLRHGA